MLKQEVIILNSRVKLFGGTLLVIALVFGGTIAIYSVQYIKKHWFTHTYGVWNAKPVALSLGNAPTLGHPSAPITIVEFGDFKCPTCMQWDKNVFPLLQKQFINTGEAKLVFQPYLVIPQSTDAAMAGLSIFHQNNTAFWKYYEEIYQHQGSEEQNWATPAFLQNFIRQYVPGVSSQTVMADLKDQFDLPEINAAHAEGQAVGVHSTPTIFVDGYELKNPFDYTALTKLINRDLKMAGVSS